MACRNYWRNFNIERKVTFEGLLSAPAYERVLMDILKAGDHVASIWVHAVRLPTEEDLTRLAATQSAPTTS